MNNLNDILKAVIVLKVMRKMTVSRSRQKALDMAIEIMEPIYGLSTVKWEKANCTFIVPTEVNTNPSQDIIIRQEAIKQMLPLLAEEVSYELRDDFLTDTVEAYAYLLVGRRVKRNNRAAKGEEA